MQFSTNVAAMIEGLNMVTRAIPARAAREIFNGVLIQSDEDAVVLTCSDGALNIQTRVEAEIKEAGSVVLPGRLMNDLVRRLPQGVMSVTVGENERATVRCLSSRSNLVAFNAMEYPVLGDDPTENVIHLPMNSLHRMISGSWFAQATDESRKILTGTLFDIREDRLSLVALDGFRMAIQKQNGSFEGGAKKIVVPGRVINEINKILPDQEESCELRFDSGYLSLSFGGTKVSTVLMKGEFIDYERIVPGAFATEMLVNRQAMMDAIDRASLVAKEGKNNLIRLNIGENSVTISSKAEMGDVREEVGAAVVGAPLEIAFNAKYIIDVIRNVEEDELCMKFNSPVNPCVIVSKENDSFLYLVLPVRIF